MFNHVLYEIMSTFKSPFNKVNRRHECAVIRGTPVALFATMGKTALARWTRGALEATSARSRHPRRARGVLRAQTNFPELFIGPGGPNFRLEYPEGEFVDRWRNSGAARGTRGKYVMLSGNL